MLQAEYGEQVMPWNSWLLSSEEPVQKLDDILEHIYVSSSGEQNRHEELGFHAWMPGKNAEYVQDPLRLAMLSGQAREIIRKSDYPLFTGKIEYQPSAGLSDVMVTHEKRKILNAIDVLSSMAIPALQEMRAADPRNNSLPEKQKYGTGIEAMFAVAHFRERYSLPHIHLLALSPDAELVPLYKGFISHFAIDPVIINGYDNIR